MTPPAHRRARSHCTLASACVLLAALLAGPAVAANIEKLVMPGRVTEGHADVENDCGACHDAETDEARPLLCTACHEGIGADRAVSLGRDKMASRLRAKQAALRARAR